MRPSCTKCGGYMEPLYDINDQVESVRCINCGATAWRGHHRRQPTSAEQNTKAVAKSRRATP